MNIDRLKYFTAVVETKSLRKAASLLGINPGSLSKAISTLEGELGVKLLRPEGRGIDITPEGLEVYASSGRLLEEFRRFRAGIIQRSTSPAKVLKIGTYEIFSTYFLSSAAKELFGDYELTILELTPGQIEQALLAGTIDVGLTHLPQPTQALDAVELGRFRMKIFGRPHWRKEEFLSWPFAVPTTPISINSQDFENLDLWPGNSERQIKFRFELLETALQTARLGISVLHCPEFIVKLQNRMVREEFQLVELPYPKKMTKVIQTKMFLVGKKGNPLVVGAEKKLAKFVRLEL